jgi:hypothetical protein
MMSMVSMINDEYDVAIGLPEGNPKGHPEGTPR